MILPNSKATHERARQITAEGRVIGFRTDTFYGLGADPLNSAAVRKVCEIKGREDKPILLLISDANEVERFLDSPSDLFTRLAKNLWPGPLTLVGTARPELSDYLTSGTGTVGVRLPHDERVRDLARSCGGALTATSANPSGLLPALTAAEVELYFPGLLELIIDDGEVIATEPSTVVDTTEEVLRVIRPGAITREDLVRAMKI